MFRRNIWKALGLLTKKSSLLKNFSHSTMHICHIVYCATKVPFNMKHFENKFSPVTAFAFIGSPLQSYSIKQIIFEWLSLSLSVCGKINKHKTSSNVNMNFIIYPSFGHFEFLIYIRPSLSLIMYANTICVCVREKLLHILFLKHFLKLIQWPTMWEMRIMEIFCIEITFMSNSFSLESLNNSWAPTTSLQCRNFQFPTYFYQFSLSFLV